MKVEKTTLEETLNFEPEPHPFKAFSELRHIPKRGIAKRLNVTYEMIRLWLNGYMAPTKKREAQLQTLKNEILQWEAEKGHLYDGRVAAKVNPLNYIEPTEIVRKAMKKCCK